MKLGSKTRKFFKVAIDKTESSLIPFMKVFMHARWNECQRKREMGRNGKYESNFFDFF